MDDIKAKWTFALLYARWVLSPKLLWCTVAALLATLLFAFWHPITERHMRLAGLALVLIGNILGFIALDSTRKYFQMPSFADEVRAWLKRRPGRSVTIQIGGAAITSSAGSVNATGWSTMATGLSIEQRINALVANLETLRKQFDNANVAHDAALNKFRTEVDTRLRDVSEALSLTSRKLVESQTRGLWMAHAALILVFMGTILLGYAPEFAATPTGEPDFLSGWLTSL
jgi:hypothetical protein